MSDKRVIHRCVNSKGELDCWMFWCPGCDEAHGPTASWQFNGDLDRPTFSPSILVRGGHYTTTHHQGNGCWCTFNAEHPDNPSEFKCKLCHSFVKDGQIQFLNDCSHALAGQTVPLEPW